MSRQIKIVADDIFYGDVLVARIATENQFSGQTDKFKKYIVKEYQDQSYVCRSCKEEY